jgi:hypothetical protein
LIKPARARAAGILGNDAIRNQTVESVHERCAFAISWVGGGCISGSCLFTEPRAWQQLGVKSLCGRSLKGLDELEASSGRTNILWCFGGLGRNQLAIS